MKVFFLTILSAAIIGLCLFAIFFYLFSTGKQEAITYALSGALAGAAVELSQPCLKKLSKKKTS